MADQRTPILDVVGAVEAKEILHVELTRISRWREKGRLPPPYADLAMSPVWVRADIEAVRDGVQNGYTPPPAKPLLLGLHEVHELLDIDKSQISRWRSKPPKAGPSFPDPVAAIRAGPLWDRRDILAFARARRKK